MLKLVAATFFSISALHAGFYLNEKIENKTSAGTCYGYTPCDACSNCSQCKFCKAGGTCGKCAKTKETYKKQTPAPISTQCKAITKKGARCTRNAKSDGYCWQHE